MIELDMKEKKYLQVSKHFQQINTTPIVTKDESKVAFEYHEFVKKCVSRHAIRSFHALCFVSYPKLAQNNRVI